MAQIYYISLMFYYAQLVHVLTAVSEALIGMQAPLFIN